MGVFTKLKHKFKKTQIADVATCKWVVMIKNLETKSMIK